MMARAARNLEGQRFGKYVVGKRIKTGPGNPRWEVFCDCGNVGTALAHNLVGGKTKSCGCARYARVESLLNSAGYVLVNAFDHPRARKNTGRVLEHILVMEASLGRSLLPHENVHHINGVRHDNRIENLELWSTSQPPGQRVSEKIEWAKMIVNLYEEMP